MIETISILSGLIIKLAGYGWGIYYIFKGDYFKGLVLLMLASLYVVE